MSTTRETRRPRVGIPATALVAALTFGLAFGSAVSAATFTVGPGGTHATIQSAIDDALAMGGSNEIHVAAGTYFENLEILAPSLESLTLSGGWIDGFSRRAALPAAVTVVDAKGSGRALQVRILGGSGEPAAGAVTVTGFTFTGARVDVTVSDPSLPATRYGAGVSVSLGGGATLTLSRNWILANEIFAQTSGFGWGGGGVGAQFLFGGSLRLERNTIAGNVARGLGGSSSEGGGVWIWAHGATVEMLGNTVSDNGAAGGSTRGGGLFIHSHGSGRHLVMTDNQVIGNWLEGAPDVQAAGGAVELGSGGTAELRRNRWFDNRGEGIAPPFQVEVSVGGSAGAFWSDDLVARGGQGAWAIARGDAFLHVANLTIADHESRGLRGEREPGSRLTVFNTIAFGNGLDADLVGVTEVGNNLIGIDPRFITAPLHSDDEYKLQPGSPGIDTGNNEPPGGLGPFDVLGQPRVQGPQVDIGAHEAATGLCRVDRFGEVAGVPAFTPACSCFRDDTLRSLRCGFYFPDLFLVARIPLPLIPGQDIKAEWSLHPWAPFAGEPYRMEAVLDWMGKETPASGRGKLEGRLREDKLAAETLLFTVPFEPAVLRTTLQHLPMGGQQPVTSLTEILIALDQPVD